MAQEKEYFAFISYKREDEKWAKWLANELEHYHLPTTLNGKDLPKNLRPVFRDVDELAAGNLPEQIYHALSISKNLIVVCSPRSEKSEWVNKEIEDFIKIKGGKADNIYPFIIEGVPFSKDAEQECFPETLRKLPDNEERLGGNINEQGGRNAAVVKIVAGMLGIGFDSLWHKYEREQRRKRYMIVAFSLLFAMISLGIAGWMIRKDWEMMKIQSRAVAEQANILTDQGDSYTARRILLEVLPKDWHWKYWPNRPYITESEVAMRKACQSNHAIFRGHTGDVTTSSFSHDGKSIVSASTDSTIRIWEVATGKLIGQPLKGHNGSVYSATFSPDDKRVVSASEDSTIRIWDITTGRQIGQSLIGHTDEVNWAVFSPNGQCILSASDDNTIRIWDVSKSECIKTISEHTQQINEVSFSHDGKFFVSASADGTIRVWETITDNCIQIIEGAPFISVSFSPNGRCIVSATGDKTIEIWDIFTGKLMHTLIGHTNYINSVSYSSDGKYVVSASSDNSIRIWDSSNGKCIQTLGGYLSRVNSASFSPNNQYVVSSSGDNTIHIWEVDLNMQTASSDEDNISQPFSANFSPDGKCVVLGYDDGTIMIHNTMTGQQIGQPLEGHTSTVFNAIYSPDCKFIASASGDHTIRIWDVLTGRCLHTLNGHTDKVLTVSFSSDGERIVSASNDMTVRIWDVITGRQIGEPLKGHKNGVRTASFSPDDAFIVSASWDGTIRFWNSLTGQQIGLIQKGSNATFSPDGKHIVSAPSTSDNSICIWDVTTKQLIGQPLIGHTDYVNSVLYNPEGDLIVSASDDKTIKIWNVKTGECLQTMVGHTGSVFSAVFSSDSKRIVSTSGDGTIRIWDFLPLQQLIDETRERFKNRPLTPEERRKYYLE